MASRCTSNCRFRFPIATKSPGPSHPGFASFPGKAGGEKREEEKRDQKADVKRDSAEERVRQERHKKADYGEDSEETESAGENDGQGVACGELQEHSERDLRADYGHREKNEAGGVHIESERDGQEENGREISQKDSTERDWQRNYV